MTFAGVNDLLGKYLSTTEEIEADAEEALALITGCVTCFVPLQGIGSLVRSFVTLGLPLM